MSPLGVVPDGVASPHPEIEILIDSGLSRGDHDFSPDPLRDRTVLLLLLSELALDAEGLQGGHDGL